MKKNEFKVKINSKKISYKKMKKQTGKKKQEGTRLSVYIVSFFQTEGLLKHVLFVFGNGFFNIFPQFFGQAHNINIQKATHNG